MAMDSKGQRIFLFGGWDGQKDLADFWCYDIVNDAWNLLAEDTEKVGGPSARSCHKMVFDSRQRQLFVLGYYVDVKVDKRERLNSDFFVYDVDSGHWTMICDDTAALGGPNLLYDHQIVLDERNRTLFVFGGSIVNRPEAPPAAGNNAGASVSNARDEKKLLSGLYEFHIPTNTWRKRRDDEIVSANDQSSAASQDLRLRSSHTMLFHESSRRLLILGGQRRREELNDFVAYSVDTDQVQVLFSSGGSASNRFGNGFSPELLMGHTQRATIDNNRDEIHMMTGLQKCDHRVDKSFERKTNNSLWVFQLKTNKWTCVHANHTVCPEYWQKQQYIEPRPRYAHEFVFDTVNRVHFLFGGNPGSEMGREDASRLGDFWRLTLARPSRNDVARRCQLSLRKGKFTELAASSSKIDAVGYLQTKLSEVVDHDDKEQEQDFQKLVAQMFLSKSNAAKKEDEDDDDDEEDEIHVMRNDLFEKLACYFPASMTHPRSSLVDLIPSPSE